MPIGPNYSVNRDDNQYITLFFRRSSISNFNIMVNGTYSGLWVKCYFSVPQPNCTNGWMNMYHLAEPAGYPGNANNSDGCASGVVANGASGTFKCTFGTQSSTFSNNNILNSSGRWKENDSILSSRTKVGGYYFYKCQ